MKLPTQVTYDTNYWHTRFVHYKLATASVTITYFSSYKIIQIPFKVIPLGKQNPFHDARTKSTYKECTVQADALFKKKKNMTVASTRAST